MLRTQAGNFLLRLASYIINLRVAVMQKKYFIKFGTCNVKTFHTILLFICFSTYGQSNFFEQPKYSIPSDDFVTQFSDTSNLSRIYCYNKKEKKVWLTNVRDYLLTLKLKDSNSKKIELVSAKYKNGIVEGVELRREALRKASANRPVTLNFSDVSSITIQSYHSVESPYFDFDSCKKIWKWKTDSLSEHYSNGKEVVLYLISKKDSLLICADACYNINFNDNIHIKNGVVQKITTDSIYISNSFDSNTAKVNNGEYKILRYSVYDIKNLKLLDRGGYTYKNISASDYNIVPLEMERNKLVPSCWFKINSYSGNVDLFRAVLTMSGFRGIREENGKLYWYE